MRAGPVKGVNLPMGVGIEAINAYIGRLSLDVRTLFEARGLDLKRFGNLMMAQKSVNLPCEDAVTNGVNAAKPLLAALSAAELGRIEFLIVGTESGLDFGKPISTYIHHHLGLSRRCRSFEVKHACYGGTAALQTAAGFVASSGIRDLKALVIATDAASAAARNTYWEPSQGAGAVAMLVGEDATILELDTGASGYYSHEVMDTCRPRSGLEAGDSDLSLLSYLECLERSYGFYQQRVAGADIQQTFEHLVFHTPFAGMVKGAHRTLMRKHTDASPDAIEQDFELRVADSLAYCMHVGNIYSAALYLALCSLIDHGRFDTAKRAGLFSYGSGCASEFYSGVIGAAAPRKLGQFGIKAAVADRYALGIEEYDTICDLALQWMFGVEDGAVETAPYAGLLDTAFAGRDLLVLRGVRKFHREYGWS